MTKLGLFLDKLCPAYRGDALKTETYTTYVGMLKESPPLSASLPMISFNVAFSLDTDLLIMPTHMSVGTLVSDQSLTQGGVHRAGKLYREMEHKTQLTQQHMHNLNEK